MARCSFIQQFFFWQQRANFLLFFYITLSIILGSIFSTASAATASAASLSTPLSITIGVVSDNEPYSTANGRIAKGFSIDVLNKLSETLDIRFDYRVGSWPDIYSAFLRGELDAIDEISWREDRAEKILFTQPYHLRQTVIMHNSSNPLPKIEQLDELKPYRVGIMRDIYYRDYLVARGVNVTEYDLLPNLVQALAFGWVDGIIGPEITLNYMAQRDGFFQLETNTAAPLNGLEIEDFRIGTLKSRPELFNLLNNGLKALPKPWLEQLNERWMKHGGQFPIHAESLKLSQKQSTYLKQLPPLRVGLMRDYAPFSFSEAGKVQGLSVDILYRLQDITDVEFVPVSGQWTNLFQLFKQGDIDIIANISDLPERRAFTLFTQTYHRIPNVAFTHDASFRLNKPSDLSGLRIAVGKGVFYEKTLKKLFGDQIISFTDQASLFKALAHNQVDVVLAALPNGNHWVRELGLTDIWVAGELELPGLIGEDLRLGLQPELAPLRDILNQALQSISMTEKRLIENRWLGAKASSEEQPSLNLSPKEKSYLLTKNNTLRYCIHPSRFPLEQLDWQNNHEGMSASFLTRLQKQQDIQFQLYPTSSWAESLSALKEGQCDLIPMAIETHKNQDKLQFTTPWHNAANVIIGAIDAPFIDHINELSQRSIGISQDSALIELLEQRYPDLNLVPVPNALSGIQQVRQRKLYGFIGGLATTSHLLQKEGMGDVRVLGRLPMDSNYSIAIAPNASNTANTSDTSPNTHDIANASNITDASDTLIFLSLMQKLQDNLNKDDLKAIENDWTAVKLEQSVDYSRLWQLAIAATLLLAALMYWNRKLGSLNNQLKQANERLAHISITDELTGLGNRNYLNQVFSDYRQECYQQHRLFAVALVDADHFKLVNDHHGHHTGDQCLKALADMMQKQFNHPEDHLVRFGGEEFIVLTSGQDYQQLCQRLDLLRQVVSKHPVQGVHGTLHFTISIGALIRHVKPEDSLDFWLHKADSALYQAKKSGRNRLTLHSDSCESQNGAKQNSP
jgi:diguanylate cyclase (GGDEF)-like protein